MYEKNSVIQKVTKSTKMAVIFLLQIKQQIKSIFLWGEFVFYLQDSGTLTHSPHANFVNRQQLN
jgi:hypothetical protein